MTSAVLITNLLYRYAELMDSGDLETVAALFTRAEIKVGGGEIVRGAEPMLALWRANVKLYPDGTPRTKHIITNPIVEVDEVAGTATCRSYYTVIQQAEGQALQPICAGRYHDSFARDDAGHWYFSGRDYSMLDLIGDFSHHLLRPVGAHDTN